jgi:hypothetical protein
MDEGQAEIEGKGPMLSHAGTRAIALLMIALATSFAQAASIRYDLRAIQDGTVGAIVRDAKNVHVSSASGAVKMQLWAMVQNLNGNNDDDGFMQSHFSFLSSGGQLLGNLSAENVEFFKSFRSNGPGWQSDLDGDGDLDIGDNNHASAYPSAFFSAHSGLPSRLWPVVPESLKLSESITGEHFSSFLIGSLTFSFSDLDTTSNLSTPINVRPRIRNVGLAASQNINIFTQDGQKFGLPATDPSVEIGSAVNVTTALVSSVPEPATWLLAALGCLGIVAFRLRRTRVSI